MKAGPQLTDLAARAPMLTRNYPSITSQDLDFLGDEDEVRGAPLRPLHRP